LSPSKIVELSNEFGPNPIILKDYVKSEKHHWNDACFIPNASNKHNILAVLSRFLELCGDYLNEGIVSREFIELEYLTNQSKSNMPLTKEYRIVFLNNKIMQIFKFWDKGVYDDEQPNMDIFQNIAETIERISS
jgi:hypothetical protein